MRRCKRRLATSSSSSLEEGVILLKRVANTQAHATLLDGDSASKTR